MKKIVFTFLVLGANIMLWGQGGPTTPPKVATNYTFTQGTSVYTEITGGTVVGASTSDDHVYVDTSGNGYLSALQNGTGIPIGFNFVFNTHTFDRLAVCTNGWISFGKSAYGASAVKGQNVTDPLSTLADYTGNPKSEFEPYPELRSRVSALGFDLVAQVGSEMRVETLGSAPNRICVIQWKGFKARSSGNVDADENYNFQIRLTETTNQVEVLYGAFQSSHPQLNTFYGVQVGLGGYDETDFHNRWIDRSSGDTWTTTRAGFIQSNVCSMGTGYVPVNGTSFRWLPTSLSASEVTFQGVQVYPTNFDHEIQVANLKGAAKIECFDVAGKLQKEVISQENSYTLDTSKFAKGMYFLKISMEGQRKIYKLIK